MKNKLKTMLHSLCAIGFALLIIVLFALRYCYVYDGYDILRLYQVSGFSEFMVSFFQFFHYVGLLLLLNVGILGVLQKTGVVEFKKSLKGWTYAKLVKVILTVVASLSVMVLIFVIIVCCKNGVYIGVGAILNTILEIMACVTFWLLDAKGILDGKAKQPSKEENKDSENQENVEGQEQGNDTPVEPTDENAQKPLLDNSSPENE